MPESLDLLEVSWFLGHTQLWSELTPSSIQGIKPRLHMGLPAILSLQLLLGPFGVWEGFREDDV